MEYLLPDTVSSLQKGKVEKIVSSCFLSESNPSPFSGKNMQANISTAHNLYTEWSDYLKSIYQIDVRDAEFLLAKLRKAGDLNSVWPTFDITGQK